MSALTDARDNVWAGIQAVARGTRTWAAATWAGMSGEARVGVICFGVGFVAGALAWGALAC